MTDFQPVDPNAVESQDYIDTLTSNKGRQTAGDNTMEVIFSGTALTIKVNGTTLYQDLNAGLSLAQFEAQSHWGSGVIFSEMDVT